MFFIKVFPRIGFYGRLIRRGKSSLVLDSYLHNSFGNAEFNLSDVLMRTKPYLNRTLEQNLREVKVALRTGMQLENIKIFLLKETIGEQSDGVSVIQDGAQSQGPKDPLTLALEIGQLLQKNNIDYAVGGSLAFGIWAVPRATTDVDMNVYTETSDQQGISDLLDTLELAGVEFRNSHMGKLISREEAECVVAGHHQIYFRLCGREVDIFLPKLAMDNSSKQRRKEVSVDGKPLFFLDAETIAVYKLLWKRDKDIIDLEQLFAVRGSQLDLEYMKTVLDLMSLDELDNTYNLFYKLQRDYIKK